MSQTVGAARTQQCELCEREMDALTRKFEVDITKRYYVIEASVQP